jgi:hypothetical protein
MVNLVTSCYILSQFFSCAEDRIQSSHVLGSIPSYHNFFNNTRKVGAAVSPCVGDGLELVITKSMQR